MQPSDSKFAAAERKPRILVAPLDWGLGHATRCIPLIRELLNAGCEPFIASDAGPAALLKQEFPDLPFLALTGYRARYARTKTGLIWQMLLQSPRFLQVIKKEHAWLLKTQEQYAFDAVISDNRYGLWHPGIPSIFITHQLCIKSPLGRWSENLLQKRNYRYINRFTECWVPDMENNGLAGELSHPLKMPSIPVRYTGSLSRFEKKALPETKGHLLFILSGPEPQRTLLENIIINQLTVYAGTATVVRGLPGDHPLLPSTNMLRFYNHLPAALLGEEFHKAEFIIARSGYSTVMDLAALQKKSILIPTPGQSEQEYLGRYLQSQQFTVTVSQKEFLLEDCLEKAKQFVYKIPGQGFGGSLKETVRTLLALA